MPIFFIPVSNTLFRPVKLPCPTQYAHKLAELAGNMKDHGESIDALAYANTLYFL